MKFVQLKEPQFPMHSTKLVCTVDEGVNKRIRSSLRPNDELEPVLRWLTNKASKSRERSIHVRAKQLQVPQHSDSN